MGFLDRWRLTRKGVILLKRCVPQDLIEELRGAAQSIYAERQAAIESKELLGAERRLFVRQMSTIRLDNLMIHGKPVGHALAGERILKLARAYLGKEPSLDQNSYVRHVVPGADIQALPFHQDQTILQSPLLNVWVPFDRCGMTSPGLEVVVTNRRHLFAVSGDPNDAIPVERARLDESAVIAAYGAGSLWHPALEPGDAFVFAGTTIHRSYVTPEMTQARMSMELRLI